MVATYSKPKAKPVKKLSKKADGKKNVLKYDPKLPIKDHLNIISGIMAGAKSARMKPKELNDDLKGVDNDSSKKSLLSANSMLFNKNVSRF